MTPGSEPERRSRDDERPAPRLGYDWIWFGLPLSFLLACSASQGRAARYIAAGSSSSVGPSSPIDVLTQHQDPQRTGANLHETRLSPVALRSGNFHRLFDWEVEGQIYAQPLYLADVPYGGRTIDLVIVATMANSVYAFEAPRPDSDIPPSTTPLWHVDKSVLGQPLSYNYFPMEWGLLGHNIAPLIGITATPVVDRRRGLLYVTAKSGSGGFFGFFKHAVNRLFAINLTTHEVEGSIDIAGEVTGADGNRWGFDSKYHLGRAALLEANDRIYLAFGSHQDTNPYHGWIFAYDADDLHRVAVYCATCGHKQTSLMGGIWQAGGGPVADAAGNVYVMTGNGSFEANGVDRGTSFLALDKDLRPLGSWTPATYDCLNRTDADLGSAGPLLLADSSTLIGGGKEGVLYALGAAALRGTHVGLALPDGSPRSYPCSEGTDPTPSANGPDYWSIQAAPTWESSGLMDLLRFVTPAVISQGFHHIHGSPVSWKVQDGIRQRTLVYISAERDKLRAFEFPQKFAQGAPPETSPVDSFHSHCANSSHGMPGGFLTLSADGGEPDSGIVWATMPRKNRDALHNIVPGILRAYRAFPKAGDELEELWNSDSELDVAKQDCLDPPRAGESDVGLFAKYASPTVARGKVYVPTFSGRLAVYGLRDAAPAPEWAAALAVDPLPSEVAPGQSVTITVRATNTGTVTWHPGDDVRLRSRRVAESGDVAATDRPAPAIPSDVLPHQTTTFSFHVVAADDEGTHYYRWRLARGAATARGPAGEEFGASTPEWTVRVLKPECAALRTRLSAIAAQRPSRPPFPPALRDEALVVKHEAETHRCLLNMDTMQAQ